MILLLDESGLTLHAKAQEDLLRYFEKELKPNHQVLYTNHSPFMVDPHNFDRVRIVQDRSIDAEEELQHDEAGTKVITDVLDATKDSMFPLQGALGYEVYQTLFVGANSLIVEGASDLLYIQSMSGLLERRGREGLSAEWTITPVGGSDKVPTFVSLIGSQKGMLVATLIDVQKKDRQLIDNLYKKKLLQKKHVLTFGDFANADEADIEDMFEHSFYLKLVNGEYGKDLDSPIDNGDLASGNPRILVRLEQYLQSNPLKTGSGFNHYRPARYLSDNLSALEKDICEETLTRFESAFKKLNQLVISEAIEAVSANHEQQSRKKHIGRQYGHYK